MLLDAGAEVNAPDDDCGITIQLASLEGHDKIVQILLEIGIKSRKAT